MRDYIRSLSIIWGGAYGSEDSLWGSAYEWGIHISSLFGSKGQS